MRRILLVVLLAALVSSCTKTTSVRRNPMCMNVLAKEKEVLILPPETSVKMVGIGKDAGKRMYGYEDHVEDLLKHKIEKAVRKIGLKTKILTRKNIHDRKLVDKVLALRESYNVVQAQLYETTQMPEEKAYAIDHNLGKPAIELGTLTNSKLIFLTDYDKAVKTNTSRALEFGLGILGGRLEATPANTSIIVTGIIDARNGTVLWTNRKHYMRDTFGSAFDNAFSSQSEIDDKELDTLISSSLKSLSKEETTTEKKS